MRQNGNVAPCGTAIFGDFLANLGIDYRLRPRTEEEAKALAQAMSTKRLTLSLTCVAGARQEFWQLKSGGHSELPLAQTFIKELAKLKPGLPEGLTSLA